MFICAQIACITTIDVVDLFGGHAKNPTNIITDE